MTELNDKKNLTESFLPELKKFLKSESVFGEPYTIDGVTIIPVHSVRVGFAFGGTNQNTNDAGGGGGGVTLTPVAFLIIREGNVTFQPINSGIESFIDRIPEFVEKSFQTFSNIQSKKKSADSGEPDTAS